MKKAMCFAKGFLAGSLVCGAVCMMIEPPSSSKIKKAYSLYAFLLTFYTLLVHVLNNSNH